MVRSSSGRVTAWINGVPQVNPERSAGVRLLPGSAAEVMLRPGTTEKALRLKVGEQIVIQPEAGAEDTAVAPNARSKSAGGGAAKPAVRDPNSTDANSKPASSADAQHLP